MKLGIIGSGMIVHDFLTTADQIKTWRLWPFHQLNVVKKLRKI